MADDLRTRLLARLSSPSPLPECDCLRCGAVAALRVVLDLHRRSENEEGDSMTVMYGHVCLQCSDDHALKNSHATGIVLWPCPTLQAIAEALGVGW